MGSTAALLPVILLIACGWGAAKLGWVRQEHIPSLANLVFLVLLPSVMFRSMAQVSFADLDYYPIFIYLGVALSLFLCVSLFLGCKPRSFVIALGCIFSNHMMVGVPLVVLAYGGQALITLITLVSIHALVLLTFAVILLEWSILHEQRVQEGSQKRPSMNMLLKLLGKTVYRAIVHPVILPIIFGVCWALTGWKLPGSVDKTLQMLGQANGAVSLILVGVMLAYTQINGSLLRQSLLLSFVKNLIFPALVFTACWLFGVRGLTLVVLTVAAGLPIGNNVLLFSARNKIEEGLITASLAVTSVTSIFTLAIVMTLLEKWVL